MDKNDLISTLRNAMRTHKGRAMLPGLQEKHPKLAAAAAHSDDGDGGSGNDGDIDASHSGWTQIRSLPKR